MNLRYIIILLFLMTVAFYAQSGEVYGIVTDNKGQPLIGANIIIANTLLGTATDSKGKFRISNVRDGNYKITASVVGFSKVSFDFKIINGNKLEVIFKLKSKSYQFDELVIQANKYSQSIKEIAASSYIIDQKIFSQKNFKQIDDALRYVPGVTMIADQLSIRGSSGYSRGAGTRVLITLDGIPIYTPDSGDIVWELVPISEIGRVEILKGSASSLYGSSAIGGVVNIISKEISSNPVTYVKFQGGIYSNPSHADWKWSDKTLSFNNQTISHSRAIGKLSLTGSITRFEDYSYKQNDYQLRFAGFLKAIYQFTEKTSLTFLGTGYTRDKESFNYWKDISNALSPPDEDIGQSTISDRTIVGLTFDHIFNENFSISFIPSAYISYWRDDSESRNNSSSKLYRSDLRTHYNYSNILRFISGFEFQSNSVSSNIFGNSNSNGFGIYSQAEYKPIDQLNLSLGVRYDYNTTEGLKNTNSFSPKIGATYELTSQTLIRALIAKGFRAPTLAEAFTSTTTSGITVKPNPNIKSETSFSMEIGINHIFNEFMSGDISIFDNEYFDLIEPGFDPTDGAVFFDNVIRARIRGVDLSSTIFFPLNLNLKLGYTYLWAKNIEENTTLNYRPKNTLLAGLKYDNNNYEVGFDFRYISRFENIDFELVDLGIVPDGDKRVDIFVLDLSAGINLFNYGIPSRLYLNVNNLLNYNYIELIGNIAPIRSYSINVEFIF